MGIKTHNRDQVSGAHVGSHLACLADLMSDPCVMSEIPPSPASSPEGLLPCVLTVDELASLLRVNRDTAYKAIADGQIPGTRKIGRNIRISRDAVIEWLRGKDHVPRSERSTL
ncbi:MAG: helix-turn-helix domain-containing protein [Nitrospinota bacterium]|jgi:excisionase family DNA binding protein|nr:helix-turn-helix domain-containing protein [Nitrospinota bacterium]MDP7661679.1 helix-turn-helix domain-containing protein [Nitrospinota bacterium]